MLQLSKSLLVATAIGLSSAAAADTISFGLADYRLSTVALNAINLFPDPATAPALPADESFTLPTLAPGDTQLYLPQNVGRFIRHAFVLPTGFSNLTFEFTGLVNDEFALYLNDVVIAQQTSTGVDNFFAPLPAFVLGTDGVAVDTSATGGMGGKLEYLLTSGMQDLFRAGTNELTLFGTDTLEYGSIVLADARITHDAPHGVPEPPLAALLGAGIAGLALLRRGSAQRVRVRVPVARTATDRH